MAVAAGFRITLTYLLLLPDCLQFHHDPIIDAFADLVWVERHSSRALPPALRLFEAGARDRRPLLSPSRALLRLASPLLLQFNQLGFWDTLAHKVRMEGFIPRASLVALRFTDAAAGFFGEILPPGRTALLLVAGLLPDKLVQFFPLLLVLGY